MTQMNGVALCGGASCDRTTKARGHKEDRKDVANAFPMQRPALRRMSGRLAQGQALQFSLQMEGYPVNPANPVRNSFFPNRRVCGILHTHQIGVCVDA